MHSKTSQQNAGHLQPLSAAEFGAPKAEARIAPFWFWNSAMDEETVLRQVQQMADAGCGGFFIHARQGLTLPYLSQQWFERVKIAVEAAHELGLEAWLYDEYPYPSGIAGGLVTANKPETRARVLNHSTLDVIGGETTQQQFELGRVVSALACPLEDGEVIWERAVDIRKHLGVVLTRELFWLWPMAHIPYNEKRFMADEGRLVLTWTPPTEEAKEWRIFVGIETEFRGFKYYDCFVDPLVPGAVEEFLQLTHERYAEELGQYFGNTIPGIFTDEIEPPAWSPQIENALAVEGLDLSVLLPALRYDEHPRAREVRRRFRECALRLFRERWEKPVADWCAAHNLLWAAEKPTLRPAQFLDVAQPSTDAGHRRIDLPPEPLTAELRANHRAAMAAAEQSGTERVRCECFHSLGWGATLQDQKWAIDWLTVQGVNRFTPHAFYATSSGLTKHDAAPSFFAETPAWRYFKILADYAARLSLAMSTGRERARIAILHPTESLWLGGEIGQRVRTEYEWLLNSLLKQHHIFHPVDAQALHRATPAANALELGHARYETLIVPPLAIADEDTQSAIRAALNAGLVVVMASPLDNNESVKQLAALSNILAVQSGEEVLAQLEKTRAISFSDKSGKQSESVWTLWREAGAQQLVFVANTGDEEVDVALEVSVAAQWQKWSLEDGAVESCAAQIEDGRSKIALRLPPFGSALLVGDGDENAESTTAQTDEAVDRGTHVLPINDWELALDRPNALRLNRWRIACADEDYSSDDYDDASWKEVVALPLLYLDQTKKQWMRACEYDENEAGEKPDVWYRRHVTCEFVPDDLALMIENGAILGDWTLWINGNEVSRDEFAALEYNGEDRLCALITRFFKQGENVLALRVRNAPEMGGLRTPLHLIGSFGLGGDNGRTLVPLAQRGSINDLAANGLPHFSGTVFYRRTLQQPLLFSTLQLPPGFTDIAELKVNGKSLGVCAWSPYRWELPQATEGEVQLQEVQLQEVQLQEVQLQIAVTNTLLPFIEGCQWDVAAQKSRPV